MPPIVTAMKPDVVKFMSEKVVPDMAAAMGDQPFDPKTHKGFGVSFMEDKMEWHYLPMSAAQYATATQDIESLYSVPSRIMGLAG